MKRAEHSLGLGVVIRNGWEGIGLYGSEEVARKSTTPAGSPMLTPAVPTGLDDSLQDYCFEDWQLPGKYLLQLCPRSLEALTVWPLGHQELILEGVEQLRALVSEWWPHWLQFPPTWGCLEGWPLPGR